MDARAVLEVIRRASSAGGVELTYHAENESLPARGLTPADIGHALEFATDAEPQDDVGAKWKVYGPVVSGEEYAMVVRVLSDGRVRVITAHLPP